MPVAPIQIDDIPVLEAGPMPPSFHLMTKPSGAICNLDCKYCYFLSKEKLYPGSNFRMSETLLEEYTRQYIAAQQVPEVTFAWQGGEPTLMGLDFFREAVAAQQKHRKPGMRIFNSFQTNGVLLNDEWARFFRENDFLIGLSVDGPAPLHDAYRVDKGGQPTFARVMRGREILDRNKVDFNILCTVHAANADHPLEVYRFFRDELQVSFMQFIPIVERDNDSGYQEGDSVKDRSVGAEQYGKFLSDIFDDWVRHDVGRVFVQIFDVALATWSGNRPGLCIFEETCGAALAMEHNGDVFSCDHYVEPDYRLGNINLVPLEEMVGSQQQFEFGQHKRDSLPQYCLDCEVRFVCNGGCPKNRFIQTPDGEEGLNYLCAGYRHFFNHIRHPMELMTAELHAGRPPANVMLTLAREQMAFEELLAGTGRNDPCPCGSGRKFKRCHGRSRQN